MIDSSMPLALLHPAQTPEEATPQEALQALGGPLATNVLAQALAAQVQSPQVMEGELDPAFEASLVEAAEALGGDEAKGPLVEAVRDLTNPNNKFKQPGVPGNLTSKWVARNWSRVRPLLISYLESKPAMAARQTEVEDFVQSWVMRLVDRDHLAPYIACGKPIRDSVLKVWLYQKAVTNVRGMGVDANTRHTHRALTERERRAARRGEKIIEGCAAPMKQVFQSMDKGDVRRNPDSADLMDPGAMPLEDMVDRRHRLETIRRALRAQYPQDAKRYVALFDAMISGDEQAFPELNSIDDGARTQMVTRVRRAIEAQITRTATA